MVPPWLAIGGPCSCNRATAGHAGTAADTLVRAACPAGDQAAGHPAFNGSVPLLWQAGRESRRSYTLRFPIPSPRRSHTLPTQASPVPAFPPHPLPASACPICSPPFPCWRPACPVLPTRLLLSIPCGSVPSGLLLWPPPCFAGSLSPLVLLAVYGVYFLSCPSVARILTPPGFAGCILPVTGGFSPAPTRLYWPGDRTLNFPLPVSAARLPDDPSPVPAEHPPGFVASPVTRPSPDCVSGSGFLARNFHPRVSLPCFGRGTSCGPPAPGRGDQAPGNRDSVPVTWLSRKRRLDVPVGPETRYVPFWAFW